jgi:hypothetical protein
MPEEAMKMMLVNPPQPTSFKTAKSESAMKSLVLLAAGYGCRPTAT